MSTTTQEENYTNGPPVQQHNTNTSSTGSPQSQHARSVSVLMEHKKDNKKDIPHLKIPSFNHQENIENNAINAIIQVSPSSSPTLYSADFGKQKHTRPLSSTSSISSVLSVTHPHSAVLSSKSAEIAMLRELSMSTGSLPPSTTSTTSSTSTSTSTSTTSTPTGSPQQAFNLRGERKSLHNSGNAFSPPDHAGHRYSMLGKGYQRTSQSDGNILSRPSNTTSTLTHTGEIGLPSRSGSPELSAAAAAAAALTRSTSDQTPKKKTVDDFHIGRVLGEGSYGAVVEATDKETGSKYAIKILMKKHIVKEKKVKYATTERDILGQCFHPGIVKLFYTFSSEASLYYVLEICSNGELLTHIKRFGGLEEQCVKFYAAEIIEALEYLHSKRVVHRDLKPENILLSADWHLKLTDFGTAKILGAEKNARSNSFVGTAEYVSPELISPTKEICCASDLWSLGSIIYQMIANRLPFKGKTNYLTFNKVSTRDFIFPANFPPLAKDLVEQLLVLNPDDRLGAKVGGYAELKSHPFFNGINWSSLRDQTPPTLDKPATPLIFEELSPPPSPTSQLKGSEGISLSGGPSGSPRMRTNSDTRRFSKFLQPDEMVTYTGLVWKRKGLSIKKRHLVLTNVPRLLYIDPKKMIVRGEIPWSEHLRPKLKSSANFNIHTPKRKYILEDTSNNAQKWVDQIQASFTAWKSSQEQ